jgi:hypothetical protein
VGRLKVAGSLVCRGQAGLPSWVRKNSGKPCTVDADHAVGRLRRTGVDGPGKDAAAEEGGAGLGGWSPMQGEGKSCRQLLGPGHGAAKLGPIGSGFNPWDGWDLGAATLHPSLWDATSLVLWWHRCPNGATGESPGWNPGYASLKCHPCPEGAHETVRVASPAALLGRGVGRMAGPRVPLRSTLGYRRAPRCGGGAGWGVVVPGVMGWPQPRCGWGMCWRGPQGRPRASANPALSDATHPAYRRSLSPLPGLVVLLGPGTHASRRGLSSVGAPHLTAPWLTAAMPAA